MKTSRLRARQIIFAFGLAVLVLGGKRPAVATAVACDSGPGYIVQWGDTLALIARRFGSTHTALAALNGISNPNRILAGQSITLPGGEDCAQSGGAAATHVVRRGETLWRIAAHYGSSVSAFAGTNRLSNPELIYVGQRLSIPGAVASAPAAAGEIFAALHLSTANPEQGRTLSLSLPVAIITNISGTLGAGEILFFSEGEHYYGLVGVDALAVPGSVQLSLHANDGGGASYHYARTLTVVDGSYSYEDIVLSASVTDLLSDPTVTANERQLLADTVSPVTVARYWQGHFQRPAGGGITSDFGTRRSYNGGGYNSYHGGVDFSAQGGTAVRAPAPGRVVLAQRLHVRGNVIIIDHGLGVYSALLHQEQIYVGVGDTVTAGQHIGEIGATGLVTGPHLHWEMYLGGLRVDPMQWTQVALP
ncbi:MAG: LysM peptidoglycan-binding domain-containing M23 family metallopeptidase [Anaerolineales bacterium]|jgi:murein DD-endopeptidase MepM/ murein hydrolase activator NlpD|nr:LysM peptidoglycan-binding domain-containing M23 family metallopeptidase [Anaerolineales bacterium]MDP7345513.1 LysM peptidoglycan-binding domain-containing M23 family metallopeptidase [Anaerolineales bacterium]MDP7643263.1 LysM peptidoglycan-binding domain-containing M23 family metallopeptidase [Anaerolineales bacterium]HJN42321.1 LysM peptidoglycan-binding domain-containing M23 family metallopeptidase [Anaerolineales bacterium]|tara:strand:+ start:1122 stop:2378 length:1257 start_codon:yes stop_codon:yes gene_type:complete